MVFFVYLQIAKQLFYLYLEYIIYLWSGFIETKFIRPMDFSSRFVSGILCFNRTSCMNTTYKYRSTNAFWAWYILNWLYPDALQLIKKKKKQSEQSLSSRTDSFANTNKHTHAHFHMGSLSSPNTSINTSWFVTKERPRIFTHRQKGRSNTVDTKRMKGEGQE